MLVRAASQKKKKPRMGQSQDVYTAQDLLEVKPHFKAFRIASVKTAAASANASAKALPPRASAVFF